MSSLEKELGTELLSIYDKCSTIGYRPTYFKRMLTSSNPRFYKGPTGTVRHLMLFADAPAQSGFRRLVKAGKLSWTVEWLITHDPRWIPLSQAFPWVIEHATARIATVKSQTA